MLIPRGRPLYTNLNTSFVDFQQLVGDLATRRVTGALRLTAPEYAGVILFVDGAPMNAVEEAGGSAVSGLPAANRIAARAAERDGTIAVYAMSAEIATLLAKAIDAQRVYAGLSTSFTSLEKLMAKLAEEHHTGYLDITFSDGAGAAAIFLEEGAIIDCVLSGEGALTSGREVAPTVVQAVGTRGATFDVYAAAPATEEPGPAVLPPPPSAVAESVQVFAAWEEILQGTEEVVDTIGGAGTFALAFRETLLHHANAYPFLDPFAAEFDYRGGRVIYEGEPPAELSEALGECLADTVARLAFRLKRADLETLIRERHQGIADRHRAAFDRFRLTACTQELIA